MNKFNPVGWFEIYVEDMSRARKFYETVLAQPLTDLPMPGSEEGMEMVSFLWVENAPNTSGALVKHPMGQPSATGTLVYFSCDDCATELNRVAAAGGNVLHEKFPIGEHGFCGIASDTEGNTIGFHSMK